MIYYNIMKFIRSNSDIICAYNYMNFILDI